MSKCVKNIFFLLFTIYTKLVNYNKHLKILFKDSMRIIIII